MSYMKLVKHHVGGSEDTIMNVVQDVIRNIHENNSKDESNIISPINDCVTSVIGSITNGSELTRIDDVITTQSWFVCTEGRRKEEEKTRVTDNDEQCEVNATPKRSDMNEINRYRKPRKRIFTERRPIRKRTGKWNGDNINKTGSIPKRRSKRIRDDRDYEEFEFEDKSDGIIDNGQMEETERIRTRSSMNIKMNAERKKSIQKTDNNRIRSNMEIQIYNSVFSPDLCRLNNDKYKKYKKSDDDRNSVRLCWHASLNKQLLPHLDTFQNGNIAKVSDWSIEKVSNFVQDLPACPAGVAEKFREEQIDGEALLLLTQQDIVDLMNIRIGPAVKIYNAILILKHGMLDKGGKVV